MRALPTSPASAVGGAPSDSEALGARLRALREADGMSLRALSRELGISASAVSQIERGQLQPSVNRIIAMANALGVPLAAVFETLGTPEARTDEASDDRGVVVARAGSIPDLVLEGGVVFRSLSPSHDPRVQLFESTYPPRSTGSVHGDLLQHRGVEIGRVTEGELTVVFGADRVVLRAGDSITFPCDVPHLLVNDSDAVAVATWLIADTAG
jgi:transcriptional regulator with XRE-family HTH domain